MKYVKLTAALIIFITISVLSFHVIQTSKINQKYKRDYAELNHFKYGMFSVETWKKQLSTIIFDEIDQLYLTEENKETIKKQLEKNLVILIDKVVARIRRNNADTPIKQTIFESFLDVADIKKGVPSYAQAIMKEMSSSKSENEMKGILKEKIQTYMQETFDTEGTTKKDQIIREAGAGDEDAAKAKLDQVIKLNQEKITQLSGIIIILAVLLFLLEGFSPGVLVPQHFIILTLTLLVMMLIGVTTPMIDMEAKISKLSFVLFDHPVTFENQVLYFQSKSILDVFSVMIHHKEIQMKFVGVLLITFSVIFPLLKMLSSLGYYFNYRSLRENAWVKFFVEKSGKWSMADVLVVAIFMAYIGFNGIINNQLGSLAKSDPNVDILTTNGTNLQPGYYLFITYAILAMFLANFITSRGGPHAHPKH